MPYRPFGALRSVRYVRLRSYGTVPTPHWTKTSTVLTHMLIIKDALNFTFNEKVNTGSAEYASTKYLQHQPG